MWACHIMTLVTFRYVFFMLTLLSVFIINECWILSKGFSASIVMFIWFLFFNLLMWYITLIDLQILKHPCTPRINLTWSWCMILLRYYWILFASILLRIFAHSSVMKCSFICNFFWNSVKRISVNSSLNVCQNLPTKPSGPGLLFVGRFFLLLIYLLTSYRSIQIFYFFVI